VPIAWGKFTGIEDDNNHNLRRLQNNTGTHQTANSYNISSLTKTGIATYTLVVTNCPSSNIILTGHAHSYSTGLDANPGITNIGLFTEVISTSGGESNSGSTATIQFRTKYVHNGVLYNFKEANLVLYAK